MWILALSPMWVPLSASAQEECGLFPLETGAIHGCSLGTGRVTVVLAAGAGQTSWTWLSLRSRLTSSARVVTFDRPGLGESPAGQSPRTPTRIAQELRKVLEALGPSGPLVLVGHSMGGVHMLRYATLYPDEVAGVVILDTPPPGFEQERLTLLTSEERAERQRVLREGAAGGPEVVRLEREGARMPSEWDFSDFPDGLPLVVIVADSQDFGELGSPSAHRRLWMEGSREWLDLSSRSRLAVAEGSGHMVHHDRQEIVVADVLSMIAVAESSSTGWRPAKGALLAGCTGGGGGTSAPRGEHGSRRECRVVGKH
jgi:pimeloyl-ACP methyl ester carboxylesterase